MKLILNNYTKDANEFNWIKDASQIDASQIDTSRKLGVFIIRWTSNDHQQPYIIQDSTRHLRKRVAMEHESTLKEVTRVQE